MVKTREAKFLGQEFQLGEEERRRRRRRREEEETGSLGFTAWCSRYWVMNLHVCLTNKNLTSCGKGELDWLSQKDGLGIMVLNGLCHWALPLGFASPSPGSPTRSTKFLNLNFHIYIFLFGLKKKKKSFKDF